MPDIERVAACSPAELWENHVLPRKPVVLTDLLAGFPHRTLESALADLSELELSPCEPRPAGAEPADTVGAWLAGAGTDRRARPRPPVRRFPVPPHYSGQGGLAEFLDALETPSDRHVHRELPSSADGFLGFGAATTHIHIDEALNGSVHYQIAGTAEWFVAPPGACALFGPIGREFLTQVMWMSRDERRRLADLVGGHAFELRPGEALFFPLQWVHGTIYPEPSFGFTQPFGRDLYTLFLSRELPADFFRSSIAQKMYPTAMVENRYWSEFRQIHDVCKQDYATHRDRLRAVEEILRAVYERLFPEAPLRSVPFDFERASAPREERLMEFYAGPREASCRAWIDLTSLPLYDWWRDSIGHHRF